jgi:hypothetical protein
MTTDQLNDHAAKLLHLVVLPIRDMVHDGEVFDVDLLLQRYDAATLRQITILLAALADPQVPWQDALSWWTAQPTDVVPLHADEYYESPRPLLIGSAA